MQHKKLFEVLCSYYGYYLMTHSYHWNISGPDFNSVHKMLGSLYESLIEDIDEIAERMRILEDKIEISFDRISSYSIIKSPNEKLKSNEMIQGLIKSNQKLNELLLETLEEYEELNDVVTVDLLTQKLSSLQKNLWILKSSLD